MFKVRNFVVLIIASFFMVPVAFAQNEVITKDPTSGAYVYETTISTLVAQRVFEEIKLINNSSIPLAHVTCTITINGRNHDMRPMPVLKLGDSEGFDGYFEDDMNREFPKYFGKDGKFSKKNNNTVRFTFNFRGHNNDVEITDVYFGEEDLCFVVADAGYTEGNYVAPAPVQQSAPVKEATATKQHLNQVKSQPTSNSGDTTVVIDGKNYLIHDGKAYPIQ